MFASQKIKWTQLKLLQVAKRPIETILSCVLLTLVSTVCFRNFKISIINITSQTMNSQVGFFNFNAQTDRVKLWIPAGSVTRDNSLWLNSHYPPDVRYQSAIVKVNIFSSKFLEKRGINCFNFIGILAPGQGPEES